MAGSSSREPLTGHVAFDSLIGAMANERDAEKTETIRQQVWDEFGVEGAAFISDMASFSSTSRKIGVCHFLKLIHRARQIIGPIVESNNGLLLKFDADNCYAYFNNPDDAISASFEVNAAIFASNDKYGLTEQIYLSVGIDFGRILLVGDVDFFGDPVNTSSKLGEDLGTRDEVLITERALEHSNFETPEVAERMVARISEIEIQYVRLPMTEVVSLR
jgi:class 3 adenylate cyclase